MPTYSYQCPKCNKVFDAFHSMSCTDPQMCPECNVKSTKLMSASSVIFKGSGFYSTDYRDSGYLEAQKQDYSNSSSDSTSSEKSESKSSSSGAETKPDTPTEKPASKPTSEAASAKAA